MATDPVCGMYVDERTATLTLFRDNRTYYFCASSCRDAFAAPAERLHRLKRDLAIAWPLALLAAAATYLPVPFAPFVAATAATLVQFYPGRSFYRGTYDALRARVGNMDVLIAIGTTAAYGYSVVALALPGRLPAVYYFDASSLIIALILTGNYLEHLTRHRATGALRRLAELTPTTARVVHGGVERDVPVTEVSVGERLRIRPGERFPVDGRIVEGRTSVDESILTGEALPAAKAPQDRVIAGAVNGEGLVDVEATAVGGDTFVAHVGQLLTEAETSRVPLQRLANRIAALFVPAILVLALVSALGWGLGAGVGVSVALLVFVSVVITACPCAFGIATPAAIVVGTGRAAEEGILFRGEDALAGTARATVVLTDKTGTLTSGRPTLVQLTPVAGVSELELLRTAAAVEQGSEHPLARAVVEAAALRHIDLPGPREIVSEPGRGVHGIVDGSVARVVSGAALREEGVAVPAFELAIAEAEALGRSWAVVTVAGRPTGLLAFSDALRPTSRAAVAALRQLGIETVMVTGDAEVPARAVARAVGIETVHSGVSPEGKLALVQSYRARGHRVAFVGDGVNDAPALAGADVGIAIGTGSDVAKEAGQVLLLRPAFDGVPRGIAVARRTVGKVRGNLLWAIGYNVVLLPVAAGALVPLVGLEVFAVLPITGAIAMALSSTTVVLNSLSLRWASLPLSTASSG